MIRQPPPEPTYAELAKLVAAYAQENADLRGAMTEAFTNLAESQLKLREMERKVDNLQYIIESLKSIRTTTKGE